MVRAVTTSKRPSCCLKGSMLRWADVASKRADERQGRGESVSAKARVSEIDIKGCNKFAGSSEDSADVSSKFVCNTGFTHAWNSD